jgi:hypothetical protein
MASGCWGGIGAVHWAWTWLDPALLAVADGVGVAEGVVEAMGDVEVATRPGAVEPQEAINSTAGIAIRRSTTV